MWGEVQECLFVFLVRILCDFDVDGYGLLFEKSIQYLKVLDQDTK